MGQTIANVTKSSNDSPTNWTHVRSSPIEHAGQSQRQPDVGVVHEPTTLDRPAGSYKWPVQTEVDPSQGDVGDEEDEGG